MGEENTPEVSSVDTPVEETVAAEETTPSEEEVTPSEEATSPEQTEGQI